MPTPESSENESILDNPDGPQGQQRMFLLRLRRLMWLRQSCIGQLEDNVIKSLDKSIYSTYCDCLEIGVGNEARTLLGQQNNSST